MSKVTKYETDDEIKFQVSGERLLLQYMYRFVIRTPFQVSLTNHLIDNTFAKNEKKRNACQCLLEDNPKSKVLFQAVDAMVHQQNLELCFPKEIQENTELQTPEFQWLHIHWKASIPLHHSKR